VFSPCIVDEHNVGGQQQYASYLRVHIDSAMFLILPKFGFVWTDYP